MSYGCGHDHGAGCNGGIGFNDSADDERTSTALNYTVHGGQCVCPRCESRAPSDPGLSFALFGGVMMTFVLLGFLVVGLSRLHAGEHIVEHIGGLVAFVHAHLFA